MSIARDSTQAPKRERVHRTVHAPVVRFLLLAAVPLSLAAEACAHASGSTLVPEPPPSVTSTPQEPPDEAPVVLVGAPDAGDEMPTSWSTAYGHHVPYREAVAVARKRTADLDTAIASDAGSLSAQDLQVVTSRLEAMTRAWASVFHAPDATMADKLDAVNVAAAASLVWSRRLDALGLHDTAAGFRTDARVALTFEDVADGPGKHWRSEGLALAKLCVTLASRDRITATAERCARLEQEYPSVTQRSSSRGCPCDPGDPLCSSSMSGWCRPTN